MKPVMSNVSYDAIKKIVQIGLPAAGTLYFALASIWGLPAAEQVVGTLAAVAVFLGLVLGFASKSYDGSEAKYDGSIDIEQGEESKMFSLNLQSDPDDLEKKNHVVFKVNKTK